MPNNDYILQSDAVEALSRGSGCENICSNAIKRIPAADVEPKREIVPWKVAGTFDDFHQCTKCGNMWPIFSTVEWAYCPVCGCRKFPGPPKSWTDNPWCNAVDKAMETEPPKGEDDVG